MLRVERLSALNTQADPFLSIMNRGKLRNIKETRGGTVGDLIVFITIFVSSAQNGRSFHINLPLILMSGGIRIIS